MMSGNGKTAVPLISRAINLLSQPFVLVVTPTLGRRDTLRKTCETVQRIGAGRVRHVVTCPTKVIDRVRAIVPGVEVISDGDTGGVFKAANHIFHNEGASFRWLAYINDDDFWLPDMAKILDRAVLARDEIIYGRVLFVDEQGNSLIESSSSPRFWNFPKLIARRRSMFTQQGAMFSRSLFERLGGFDEKFKLVADNDFWIRAIRGGAKCHYINALCGAYSLHGGQLSSNEEEINAELELLIKLHKLDPSALSTRLAEWRFQFENAPIYLKRFLRYEPLTVSQARIRAGRK